jgi:anti-sigma B factor antagonist
MGNEPTHIAPAPAHLRAVGPLSCRSYVQDGVTVVAVSGEIDLATASEFRSVLVDAVAGGQGDLVVDLSEVTFMDSTGLGAMVSARRRLTLRGASMRLVSPAGGVRRILDVTKLDQVIPIHDTVDAAVLDGGRSASHEG